MADVREPTPIETEDFDGLADVFGWAKIKGNIACPGSRAGSLLRLIAKADWQEAEIEDVASVSPDDFEDLEERDFVDTLLDEPP